MCGRDVFVCLPTGFGKSVCYMVLPLLFDIIRNAVSGESIVLDVSPLKADTVLFSGVSTTHLAPRLVAIPQPKQRSIAMPTHVGIGVTIHCYGYHMTRSNFRIPASRACLLRVTRPFLL